MPTPCTLKREVWTCALVRENGYRASVLWTSAKSSPSAIRISVPAEFKQYRDLDGNLQKVQHDGVPISKKPILVETFQAF
jgi:hypothetical protein